MGVVDTVNGSYSQTWKFNLEKAALLQEIEWVLVYRDPKNWNEMELIALWLQPPSISYVTQMWDQVPEDL